MGRGEIKCAGAGKKGNESARETISPFSLSFPYFLAVFPLKKFLLRREIQSHVAAIPHGTAHGRYGV